MLIDGINTLHKPFIDALIKNAKDVEQLDGIVIFGSSVREDCTEESDVDIILISQVKFSNMNYGKALFNMLSKCYEVQEVATDILEMRSITELETGSSEFFKNVREDGYKYYSLRG